MCTCYEKKATAAVKKTLKEKGQISVYKYLSKNGSKLTSGYQDFTWTEGENVSSRVVQGAACPLTDNEASKGNVDVGFHVLLTKKAAGDGCVRLVGKKADFVCANGSDGAVFSKLTLPRAEYNKALGVVTEKPAKAVKKAPVKKAVKKTPAKKATKK